MTCSPAGGLPLGFVITSSESEQTLTKAFEMLRNVLPDNAFYKKGKNKGPVIFMTDDADGEINALKTVWPEAKLLLCVWHVLNAVWRWLWQAKHGITMKYRRILFKRYKSILYAKTEMDYFVKKEELLSDDTCLKYPNFID